MVVPLVLTAVRWFVFLDSHSMSACRDGSAATSRSASEAARPEGQDREVRMQGYEVVADSLLAAGVETVFGLLGNSNLATVGVLAEAGVRFVGSRHESGAVSSAAGHAWATGMPTLCTVTHGPGLANALTALTSAVRDRLPIVLLVGDIRNQPAWQAQRADQPAMLGWTGAEVIDCADPAGLAAAVAVGFARAERQRRPVVVNIPAELLEQPAVAQPAVADPGRPAPGQTPHRVPDHTAIAQAAEALAAARRPVVLGGRGADWSGAGPVLAELAAASGALLTTTLPAIGLFAGDPYDIGVCGGYSTRTARELLRQVDCVLAFGAGLNGYTTVSGKVFPDARVVQCDLEPAAFGRHTPAELQLLGDAGTVAQRLLAAYLSGPGRQPGFRGSDPELAGRVAAARRGGDFADHSSPDGGIDPRVALAIVDESVPADRQVVIDVGHFSTFPSQLLGVPGPGRFYPALGFSAVGLGLASAIGAAVGRPVPTVVVVGDGGALMSLGELETLARYRPPVTVVVLNDHAYGAEIHHLRRHGLPETLADFPPCDLAAGSAGTTEELAALLNKLPAGSPAVLDVRVTRATVADRFAPGGH
jgi:thiamine pyrophosphate-dependent acetolactate synthase large subunit-like protein